MTETVPAASKATQRLDDIERRADMVLGIQWPSILAATVSRRATVFRALREDSTTPD